MPPKSQKPAPKKGKNVAPKPVKAASTLKELENALLTGNNGQLLQKVADILLHPDNIKQMNQKTVTDLKKGFEHIVWSPILKAHVSKVQITWIKACNKLVGECNREIPKQDNEQGDQYIERNDDLLRKAFDYISAKYPPPRTGTNESWWDCTKAVLDKQPHFSQTLFTDKFLEYMTQVILMQEQIATYESQEYQSEVFELEESSTDGEGDEDDNEGNNGDDRFQDHESAFMNEEQHRRWLQAEHDRRTILPGLEEQLSKNEPWSDLTGLRIERPQEKYFEAISALMYTSFDRTWEDDPERRWMIQSRVADGLDGKYRFTESPYTVEFLGCVAKCIKLADQIAYLEDKIPSALYTAPVYRLAHDHGYQDVEGSFLDRQTRYQQIVEDLWEDLRIIPPAPYTCPPVERSDEFILETLEMIISLVAQEVSAVMNVKSWSQNTLKIIRMFRQDIRANPITSYFLEDLTVILSFLHLVNYVNLCASHPVQDYKGAGQPCHRLLHFKDVLGTFPTIEDSRLAPPPVFISAQPSTQLAGPGDAGDDAVHSSSDSSPQQDGADQAGSADENLSGGQPGVVKDVRLSVLDLIDMTQPQEGASEEDTTNRVRRTPQELLTASLGPGHILAEGQSLASYLSEHRKKQSQEDQPPLKRQRVSSLEQTISAHNPNIGFDIDDWVKSIDSLLASFHPHNVVRHVKTALELVSKLAPLHTGLVPDAKQGTEETRQVYNRISKGLQETTWGPISIAVGCVALNRLVEKEAAENRGSIGTTNQSGSPESSARGMVYDELVNLENAVTAEIVEISRKKRWQNLAAYGSVWTPLIKSFDLSVTIFATTLTTRKWGKIYKCPIPFVSSLATLLAKHTHASLLREIFTILDPYVTQIIDGNFQVASECLSKISEFSEKYNPFIFSHDGKLHWGLPADTEPTDPVIDPVKQFYMKFFPNLRSLPSSRQGALTQYMLHSLRKGKDVSLAMVAYALQAHANEQTLVLDVNAIRAKVREDSQIGIVWEKLSTFSTPLILIPWEHDGYILLGILTNGSNQGTDFEVNIYNPIALMDHVFDAIKTQLCLFASNFVDITPHTSEVIKNLTPKHLKNEPDLLQDSGICAILLGIAIMNNEEGDLDLSADVCAQMRGEIALKCVSYAGSQYDKFQQEARRQAIAAAAAKKKARALPKKQKPKV